MRIAVLSYSFSGNNEMLANGIAKSISAQHIPINEPKNRTFGTIFADFLLNRTPKISPEPQQLREYDALIFVAPVWMGHPAFPLRAYLQYFKQHPIKYGFISISGGGSDKANPRLGENITKLAGKAHALFSDMHISDILPKCANTTPQAVMDYKITQADCDQLTGKAVTEIKKQIF
ncbi:MAG: hypothetical protein PHY15_02265 [Eubacteriales bacterium]|nr:hypothetical protein [Eubacteriales bacterium]MDD4476322.1 hypothetical protein [Eubacteriales bacterium]